MRINTNMAALNAWRTMTNNGGNLQKSLERLASGYRLNRAADDAAGLAVSEKMNAQIRGLGMATRNTQDAISMVQTAEGGAGKVQEMMQRMRELAVQAGSDTLQDSDRAKLQEEFAALQAEIDRTADTVTYNGRKLINGESGDQAQISSGTSISSARVTGSLNGAGEFSVTVASLAQEHIVDTTLVTGGGGAPAAFSSATTLATVFGTGLSGDEKITVTQGSKVISFDINGAKTVSEFVTELNTALEDAGMSARIKFDDAADQFLIEGNYAGTGQDVSVAESNFDNSAAFGFGLNQASADATFTIVNNTTGIAQNLSTDYTVSGNVLTGMAGTDLAGVQFTATTAGASTLTLSQNSLSFQVGANTGEAISTSFGNLTTANLGISTNDLNISDKTAASDALTALDTALSNVSTDRAKMGAMQNRLENTITNLQTQQENLTAANSRIRDLDMASEMAQFTKFQILSQASTAMLAQANQITQGVLSLLR